MEVNKILTTDFLQVYEEKNSKGEDELFIRYKDSRMKINDDGVNHEYRYHFIGRAYAFLFKVKYSSILSNGASTIDGFRTLRIISLTKCAAVILQTIEHELNKKPK